jgi:hypothetical protein
MAPQIPFSEIKSLTHWANFHGTIETQVPLYCTPDVVADIDDDTPSRLLRHGKAIQAVLRHCFDQQPAARLRVMGARWSMSNIIQPSDVVLDPANLNVLLKVKPEWLTPDYRSHRTAFTPVFVQGGTHISSINRRLGPIGLALRPAARATATASLAASRPVATAPRCRSAPSTTRCWRCT